MQSSAERKIPAESSFIRKGGRVSGFLEGRCRNYRSEYQKYSFFFVAYFENDKTAKARHCFLWLGRDFGVRFSVYSVF